MNRRIIAALLALMILFCALPVSAQETAEDFADCRIYEIGTIYEPYEKVWVQGRTSPQDDDAGEGYHWDTYKYLYRPGCGKEEHPRHTDECYGYVDGVYQETCTIPIHSHNLYCKVYDAQYLYWVVPDATGSDNPTDPTDSTDPTDPTDASDPSEPDVEPTGKSGFEDDPGEISLVVQSLNAAGDSLENVPFRLLREKTDEDGNAVINPDTGLPNLEPVAEDILWTNSDGQVRFNALENYVEDYDQPWLVVQEATAFKLGGDYYDLYYSNDSQWAVSVADDNSLCVALAKECGLSERENHIVPEGYSDGTLTFVNDRIQSTLDITVEFDGLIKSKAAEGSFEVTVAREPDDDEFPRTVSFPTAESTRNYSWGTSLEGLNSGTYTLTVEEPAAISGYQYLKSTVELLNEEENVWEELDSAVLGSDNALATFRVTYFYEEDEALEPPQDPQDNPANTISIIAMDELNRVISGAKYRLTDSDGGQRIIDEETGYVLDDLANVTDAGMTYTLQQTEAPGGYHLCTDVYTVDISQEGNVTLKKQNAPDDESIDQSTEGWQVAKFVNRRKTANIKLACEDVTADVDEGCWNVEQIRNAFESRSHTFCLTWKDAFGASQTETITLAEGEEKTFEADLPLGAEYKVEALEDEAFEWNIVENAIERSKSSGTIMAYQTTEEPIELTASVTYTIVPGDPELTVIMRRVEKNSNIPLAGAEYVLRDEKGTTVGTYTTQADGYITLANVFDEPGRSYTLTEEGAPAGYAQLDGAINIQVGLDYQLSFDEKVVLKQVLNETVDHEAVVRTANGHYNIATEGEAVKIKVTCDSVTANVDDRCWDKAQTKEEFESKKHTFYLCVKDENGEWQIEDAVILGKGESGIFEKTFSYGKEYKVTTDSSSGFVCSLTNEWGIIGKAQMGSTIDVHASITYTIKRGDSWHDVYLRKVNYWGKAPLSDAKFVLRDENDDIIETYITKDDGHIDIEGIFNEPGITYTLKELKAPEGFVKLNRPIEIEIVIGYEPSGQGDGVIKQVLTERITHESVEMMSDGTYIIMNRSISDIPQTSDQFNVYAWGFLFLVSAVSLCVVAGMRVRKKIRHAS